MTHSHIKHIEFTGLLAYLRGKVANFLTSLGILLLEVLVGISLFLASCLQLNHLAESCLVLGAQLLALLLQPVYFLLGCCRLHIDGVANFVFR